MTSGTTSAQLFRRALKHTPTGTHSNTRIRTPHPYYISEAHGSHVTDVDGNALLDYIMGNGSIILGHDNPDVRVAVQDAVARGATTGLESPDGVATVELLAEMIPGFDALRFANTGTEAVLHALQIARAATGRPRIAKVEAGYHGWLDQVWVSTWPPIADAGPQATPASVPGSAGLDASAGTTLVLPFNDIDATIALIDRHADELAAVIVEPTMIDIGFVPATRAYLTMLRKQTSRHGIVLIFDELLTGFRIAPGGARELYDLQPDLTTYGKAIANGYPIAAVEGRRDLLDLTDPAAGGRVGWVGTFNGHAIVMAAARATLVQLRDGSVQREVDTRTDYLRDGVTAISQSHGRPVVLSGAGGHFQVYFCADRPSDYREATRSDATAYLAFFTACEQAGVLVARNPLGHSALSAAHTDEDLDRLLDCLDKSLAQA